MLEFDLNEPAQEDEDYSGQSNPSPVLPIEQSQTAGYQGQMVLGSVKPEGESRKMASSRETTADLNNLHGVVWTAPATSHRELPGDFGQIRSANKSKEKQKQTRIMREGRSPVAGTTSSRYKPYGWCRLNIKIIHFWFSDPAVSHKILSGVKGILMHERCRFFYIIKFEFIF
jgi:hypothetical protein